MSLTKTRPPSTEFSPSLDHKAEVQPTIHQFILTDFFCKMSKITKILLPVTATKILLPVTVSFFFFTSVLKGVCVSGPEGVHVSSQ